SFHAFKDEDRLFDRGLGDHDRLEAAFEGRVLLDVLAVVVEGSGTDALELAAGERRLEDVRGVDSAFGSACTDEHVHLIDEEDAVAGALELFDNLLQALLELAAVLGAGDERANVQRDETAVEEHLGDFAARNALREGLDDGGLADAGLPDKDRVVLGAAREDLYDALDLLLAADDGVELVGASGGGKVDAKLVDGWGARSGAAAGSGALRHA